MEPFLIGFLSALNTHLEEKGWKSIYYQHILDEAHGAEPPYYARFAELVHRYLPGVPTLDAVDASHMPEELQKNCDIWVPQLGRLRRADGHDSATHSERPRSVVLHVFVSQRALHESADGLPLAQDAAAAMARFPLRLYRLPALGLELLDAGPDS